MNVKCKYEMPEVLVIFFYRHNIIPPACGVQVVLLHIMLKYMMCNINNYNKSNE